MGQKVILVCEDDELVIQLITFAVEAKGFKSETAIRTTDVFDKLKGSKPDLIILDLNIPGEGGGEYVIQQIRRDPGTEDIPIVLCSGEENLPEIAGRLKVEGYIRKPFGISEFYEGITRYLS